MFPVSMMFVLLFQYMVTGLNLPLFQLFQSRNNSLDGNVNPPAAPPGFKTKVLFKTSEPLDTKGFYLAVVLAMGRLTRLPWDDYFDRSTLKESGVEVLLTMVPHEAQVSHVVLGLYAAAVEAVDQEFFSWCLGSMYLNGNIIGGIKFLPSSNKLLSDVVAENNETMGHSPTHDIEDSGTLVDPMAPEFQLSYDFYGNRINSDDLFTAVLQGLSSVAQYYPAQSCQSIHAVGPYSDTGQVVIFIHQASKVEDLICDHVGEILKMIFVYLGVGRNKFHEMNFKFRWHGRLIASGYILGLGPVSSGGRTIA